MNMYNKFYITKLSMLIEILGNSSSLLVISLLVLSIYFGIKAKTKNIKWTLVFWIIKNEVITSKVEEQII